MMEVWKDIPGYEGMYQVGDQGRVRSLDRMVRIGKRSVPANFIGARWRAR